MKSLPIEDTNGECRKNKLLKGQDTGCNDEAVVTLAVLLSNNILRHSLSLVCLLVFASFQTILTGILRLCT